MATFIRQGRFIEFASPVCGTNGLGTCVGVAVPRGGQWFLAHIDCAAVVKSKTDPMWGRVAQYVTDKLNQLLDAGSYENVHVVGSLSEFSGQAILDGVKSWIRDQRQLTTHRWDGFQIDARGVFTNPGHAANNSDGDGAFTVPANP
jgi:hypothetical protein